MSPVNGADMINLLPFASPGVNAGPNTAFGGKPDESGSFQKVHNSTLLKPLRLFERY